MKKIVFIVLSVFILLFYVYQGKAVAQNSHIKYKGMFFHPELNVGYGLQGDLQPNEIGFAGLNATAGYWLTRKITGGIGVGIQAYNGSNTVPLTLQGGYYFRETGLGNMRFF